MIALQTAREITALFGLITCMAWAAGITIIVVDWKRIHRQ